MQAIAAEMVEAQECTVLAVAGQKQCVCLNTTYLIVYYLFAFELNVRFIFISQIWCQPLGFLPGFKNWFTGWLALAPPTLPIICELFLGFTPLPMALATPPPSPVSYRM